MYGWVVGWALLKRGKGEKWAERGRGECRGNEEDGSTKAVRCIDWDDERQWLRNVESRNNGRTYSCYSL